MSRDDFDTRCSGCGITHNRTVEGGCKVCQIERKLERMERDVDTFSTTYGVTDD